MESTKNAFADPAVKPIVLIVALIVLGAGAILSFRACNMLSFWIGFTLVGSMMFYFKLSAYFEKMLLLIPLMEFAAVVLIATKSVPLSVFKPYFEGAMGVTFLLLLLFGISLYDKKRTTS